MSVRIHPSAHVEEDVELEAMVQIWQFATVRRGARIGSRTNIGTAAYVGAGVTIGSNCKIQNAAQVFEGSQVGNGVFIGPGAILTNDRHPRAVNPDGSLKGLSDWHLDGVTIEEGASFGAGAIAGSGRRIGRWSLVAAGAVVTRDVPAFALVAGVPARRVGWVCRCSRPMSPPFQCPVCGHEYVLTDGAVEEVS